MLTIVAHEGCTNRFAEGALFALVLQYTNQVIHKVMAKHHIVQDKYLTQLGKPARENNSISFVSLGINHRAASCRGISFLRTVGSQRFASSLLSSTGNRARFPDPLRSCTFIPAATQ